VFERTRKPLRVWFQAIWLVTSQNHGAGALGLQRVLGLGSSQTAWTWLHKLRCAVLRAGRERLHGSLEADETYVGNHSVMGGRPKFPLGGVDSAPRLPPNKEVWGCHPRP